MRITHHADDLGQHRVARQFGGSNGQRALAIDRTGIDLVARLLCHQRAFAGDWSLIDAAHAFHHFAIQRDPVAAAHDKTVPHGNLCRGNILLGSIFADHPRRCWREIEQRRDGIACAPNAPAFKIEREREEERHRRRLEIRPKADGSGHRNNHQEIHVGRQPARRGPGLGRDQPGAEDDGQQEQPHLGQRHRPLAMIGKDADQA